MQNVCGFYLPKQGLSEVQFPLPRIDVIVDATVGYRMMSFMNAYSGYKQIQRHPKDEENTSFITNRGLYYYQDMPFKLKNARATKQRLVNQMFKKQIGKSMEIYVDVLLVKSKEPAQHLANLREVFTILRQHKTKLNPTKCAFGVRLEKFLGFIVFNN